MVPKIIPVSPKTRGELIKETPKSAFKKVTKAVTLLERVFCWTVCIISSSWKEVVSLVLLSLSIIITGVEVRLCDPSWEWWWSKGWLIMEESSSEELWVCVTWVLIIWSVMELAEDIAVLFYRCMNVDWFFREITKISLLLRTGMRSLEEWMDSFVGVKVKMRKVKKCLASAFGHQNVCPSIRLLAKVQEINIFVGYIYRATMVTIGCCT